MLIYDGECGFCRGWVARWKRISRDRIQFRPYQSVGELFPRIPPAEFEKAVFLVEPDRISRGAEAVFRSLAYAPKNLRRYQWPLRVYLRSRIARGLSEQVYRWVARHRLLASAMERKARGLKKVGITVFILFHVSAFLAWTTPDPNGVIQAYCDAVRGYLAKTGLWQGWAMFAPNPKMINAYVEAEIQRLDGKVETWSFPRLDQLAVAERSPMERWNQWMGRLVSDANAAIWPDAARYVARLHWSEENPPVRVRLVRHWGEVPPPEPGDFQKLSRSVAYPNHEKFYTYEVEGIP